MNDILILERAKSYLSMLAKGIDPINGNETPSDSILNQEKLRKCFEYVSGILQEIINNNGKIINIQEKLPFHLTDENKNSIILSEQAISSTELVKRLNSCVDSNISKKITSRTITKWLVKNNYLTESKMPVQIIRSVCALNEESAKIGLEVRQKIIQSSGEIKEEFAFSKEGQLFIIEHINEIATESRKTDNSDD